MKVAYTGSIFFNQSYGGISRYYTELIKNIKTDAKIFAPINKNIYLKDINPNLKSSFFIKKLPQYNFLIIINNIITNYLIKNYDPDILHETYYSDNIIKLKKYKKILTIYDLIHEKFQNNLYKNKINEKRKVLDYIDHFICISEQTKKDFIEYYNIPSNKVSVVYLGGDHLNQSSEQPIIRIIQEPYILYIGSRKKYKNFKILYEALDKLKIKDLSLICFGGEKFSQLEIKENKSKVKIHQIYGDDKVLLNLIKNAECYINTSVYEGFGIPNIEVIINKCPLICSNIPVFKEICKNAAIYFDKDYSEDLAIKINKVVLDKEFKEKILENSKKLIKLYSWKKCADDTSKVYKKILT